MVASNDKKCYNIYILRHSVKGPLRGAESLDKRKREKKAREDQALNRVLLWFGGAVVLEFFVLLLNRFYVNFDASGTELAYGIARFLRGMIWVSGICAGLSLLWTLLWRRKGKKTFWPAAAAVIWLVLGLCALVAVVWQAVGVQFLYVVVPVVAVLALIFYLYQREFFLVGLLGGLGLFALWSYRKLITSQPRAVYGIFIGTAVLTLGGAALFFLLQRGKGCLPGKKGRRLLPAKTSYILLYCACLVNVAAMTAALIWGLGVAYILLFVMVAWLFGVAIYYTVRLM